MVGLVSAKQPVMGERMCMERIVPDKRVHQILMECPLKEARVGEEDNKTDTSCEEFQDDAVSGQRIPAFLGCKGLSLLYLSS